MIQRAGVQPDPAHGLAVGDRLVPGQVDRLAQGGRARASADQLRNESKHDNLNLLARSGFDGDDAGRVAANLHYPATAGGAGRWLLAGQPLMCGTDASHGRAPFRGVGRDLAHAQPGQLNRSPMRPTVGHLQVRHLMLDHGHLTRIHWTSPAHADRESTGAALDQLNGSGVADEERHRSRTCVKVARLIWLRTSASSASSRAAGGGADE